MSDFSFKGSTRAVNFHKHDRITLHFRFNLVIARLISSKMPLSLDRSRMQKEEQHIKFLGVGVWWPRPHERPTIGFPSRNKLMIRELTIGQIYGNTSNATFMCLSSPFLDGNACTCQATTIPSGNHPWTCVVSLLIAVSFWSSCTAKMFVLGLEQFNVLRRP